MTYKMSNSLLERVAGYDCYERKRGYVHCAVRVCERREDGRV